MAFTGIEFSERGGGGVALICSEWLTPRKRYCFWPPIKSSVQFEKALVKRIPTNEQDWTQYEVSRCFFETGIYGVYVNVFSQLAMQSISLPKNCSSSISFPSTSSFMIHEYDSDDVLSKGMSDENSCNLEFNNNVIDCDRSKISTPSNDKLLKLLLFLKEQNTQILKELKILNSKPNTQRHQSFEPPLDIPVGLPLRKVEDVLSLENYLSNGDNLSALVCVILVNIRRLHNCIVTEEHAWKNEHSQP
ncbi:hypothetical protein FQA39_LY10818 [Lamprigera yunnana]|nr:hypothetical protein FQA39_LY10818 [Lamprigera yunnana]